MVSTGSFTHLPTPQLTQGWVEREFDDLNYDPIGDHIYWIEDVVDYYDDNCRTFHDAYGERITCPLTTNIGRCDYDGGNPELLLKGLTPGVYSFGSSKYMFCAQAIWGLHPHETLLSFKLSMRHLLSVRKVRFHSVLQ